MAATAACHCLTYAATPRRRNEEHHLVSVDARRCRKPREHSARTKMRSPPHEATIGGMAPLTSPTRRGRASCIVFGLVAASLAVAALIAVTMPAPTGGGEFRGVNDLGRVMAAMGLMLAAWALSVIGCVLGLLSLRQAETKRATVVGVLLNALAAGALTLWFFGN